MIQYPNFDPVLIRITDSLQIKWYGMMYILAFGLVWVLLKLRTKGMDKWRDSDTISDLIFFAAIGVLAGGRLGYILFYDFPAIWQDPISILKVPCGVVPLLVNATPPIRAAPDGPKLLLHSLPPHIDELAIACRLFLNA